MKNLVLVLQLVVSLWLAAPVLAANHYVRAGATGSGNGLDWTNACTDFIGSCAVASLIRGDTYFVACGSYATRTFDRAGSGTLTISIKAATNTAHGTDTGWSFTYGVDSGACQATFANRVNFATSYWVFDGQYRSTETSGHGFLVNNQTSPISHNILLQNNLTNITVSYTEIFGDGVNSGRCLDQLYMATCCAAGGINHRFDHLYLHDASAASIMTQSTNGVIFEYNYVTRNHSDAVCHSEAVADQGSDNLTIRYNKFVDIEGTGVIVALGRGTNLAEDNWQIYGNLFYQTGSRTYGNGVITCINSETCTNWFIYNNTFYNNVNNSRVQSDSTITWTNIQVKNNLFCNVTNAQHTSTVTADFNTYTTGTLFTAEANSQSVVACPFVNPGTFNLHLASATSAGVTLGAPYTADFDGVARGSDGIWDRGAFEFGGGDTTPPAPPTNVTIQ